jgi:GDP/UDP-N,N'-diacetylbacillosamine 2-epimerase (hydrolysing)
MRKIFLVVERRSDYSRYRPILFKLLADPFFKIHLVATGLCLLEKHGKSIDFIKEDGIKISREIPMYEANHPDSGAEMVRGMSRFMLEITDELERVKPDILLSGFDIGAQLSATIAAAHMNIPVAHVQGGELTGSIDESIRHAISKFSHIHFVSTRLSGQRLVRIGENPELVFVVGCPSIDTLINAPAVPVAELEQEFQVDFSKPVALMIQHPVTTENMKSFSHIKKTISAIKSLNLQVIVLMPNNDSGYSKIVEELEYSKLKCYPSLSADRYSNLLRHVSVLVGNSSSGIHEAPTFQVPVVNIGSRQLGREKTANVIDVPNKRPAIMKAVNKALYDKRFRASLKKVSNPYGDGRSSERIVQILKTIPLKGIIQKKFYEG